MTRLRYLVLIFSIAACGDDDVAPQRGAQQRGGGLPQQMTALGTASEGGTREAPERRLMGPTEIRETREVEGEDLGAERDLGAELRAALGSPTSCGELGEHTSRITLRFTAVVTENGIVTRGSVAGPSLPPGTFACLQGRLERVRFRGGIENAPRTVSTTLELDPVAPPTMEAPPAVAPVAQPTYGMGAQAISGSRAQAISGPSGQAIEAAPSQGIEATMGQEIAGPGGTMIQGPTGLTIGQ